MYSTTAALTAHILWRIWYKTGSRQRSCHIGNWWIWCMTIRIRKRDFSAEAGYSPRAESANRHIMPSILWTGSKRTYWHGTTTQSYQGMGKLHFLYAATIISISIFDIIWRKKMRLKQNTSTVFSKIQKRRHFYFEYTMYIPASTVSKSIR